MNLLFFILFLFLFKPFQNPLSSLFSPFHTILLKVLILNSISDFHILILQIYVKLHLISFNHDLMSIKIILLKLILIEPFMFLNLIASLE